MRAHFSSVKSETMALSSGAVQLIPAGASSHPPPPTRVSGRSSIKPGNRVQKEVQTQRNSPKRH